MSFENAEIEANKRSQARRNSLTKGYEREIRWDGSKGYIDSPATDVEPDQALWDMVIKDWGLDPNLTEIVDGSVHIRAWDANVGGGEIAKMRYYRAQIRRRAEKGDRADIEALCREIMKKPAKVPKREVSKEERAFMAFFADFQLGKGENGGTPATVERIIASQDAAIERIKELIQIGRGPSVIYCCGMGDLVENCSNHYAMQTFSVDLDAREQQKAARRLILRFVDLCVDNFPEIPIVVVAVPGNHGENRNSSGKAYTPWTDNMDLAVFEGVAEICAGNPARYVNVSFPQFEGLIEEDLTMTLNVCGVIVTLAHGHQFGKGNGGGTIAKIEAWILGQIRGRTKASEADIVVSGHFHHYIASEGSGRTCIQCPAQDGGSKWFTDQTGKGSPAGMLTFGVGTAYGKRGWGDLLII